MAYADANFFLCIYLLLRQNETADAMMELVRSGSIPPLPVTWLTRLEVMNAIELSVFMGKTGEHPFVNPGQAALAIAEFNDDLEKHSFLRATPVSAEKCVQIFEQICQRHTAKHGFRTYDILHVSMALALGCREFWSFDTRASKLAKLEGLKIL